MKIEIKKSELSGEVKAIPSKSYVHRILICRFLSGDDFSLNGFSSDDMKATVNCLAALRKGEKVLDCGESGSTLRFMIPLAGVVGGDYVFIGRGKLMERPNDELFSALKVRGAFAVQDKIITLKGKLTAGEYRLRGDVSSQYVSGLLMALPVLEGDSRIVLTTPLVSAPYADVTLEVLKNFGINIVKTPDGFFIKGGQKYEKSNAMPEGDWSNAAFFLVAGAVCGSVKVSGLNPHSVQADRFICEVLRRAGTSTEWNGSSLQVRKSKLNAFSFDAEDCPDIVPVSAVLAAYADGVSVIKNVGRLKIKESDRIASTVATLKCFGIKAECRDNNLYVYGGKPECGTADSFNDHRIAMASAVTALGADGISVITDAGAVSKSYPAFYKDLESIGGNVREI